MITYCPTCDQPNTEPCTHTGLPRYLDPIDYEHTDGSGLRVPDHERERWDSDRWTSEGRAPVASPPEPKPLRDITAELEYHAFLSDHIRVLLVDAYDANPVQTWQLAEDIKRRAGQLENPSGVLVSGLRKIIGADVF